MINLIVKIEAKYILGKGVKLIYVNDKGQKIITGTFTYYMTLYDFIECLKILHNEACEELRAKMIV